MTRFALPTITAGLTAGLSVLFFLGLSDRFGDPMLAGIILVQATVGLVQIGAIPNSWVYLLGASDGPDIARRYSEGLTLEWAGTAVAVLLVGLGTLLVPGRSDGAVFMLLSLATQASSATLGLFRAEESWVRYVAWVMLPNLVRVPLVWLAPWLVGQGLLPELQSERGRIILIFFFLPDLVRLALLYLPLVLTRYAWPGMARLRASAALIYRNWLFEIGTAITDQGDKLLVGTLLGPQVLVAYFFARRVGIVTVMVIEPFYWEMYRRRSRSQHRLSLGQVWASGLGFAGLLWALLAAAIWAVLQIPPLAVFVPAAVATLLPFFIAVMLLDSLNAANRWNRFLSQIGDRAVQLLLVRLGGFALFALILTFLSPVLPTWSVVWAMVGAIVLDMIYVGRLLSKAEPK